MHAVTYRRTRARQLLTRAHTNTDNLHCTHASCKLGAGTGAGAGVKATRGTYEADLSEFAHAFVGCVRSDAAIIVSHLAWLDKMPLMSFGATLSEFAGENIKT